MNDPATHYRDRVDPEHRLAMEAIGMARMMLDQHRERYEVLIKARSDADAFGHILNPTLYRDMIHSKSFEQQMRLVRAAQAFLRETDAVAKEIGAA